MEILTIALLLAGIIFFDYYYTKSGLFETNPVIQRPFPVKDDILPDEAAVSGARSLIRAAGDLKDIDAYQYDLVNLFRQVFGQYAGHILHEITANYPGEKYK